jgi:GDPmannose 4,6-dehydratase
MARMYRERYSLFVSNGILFNHESPIRPESYVSRKISKGVAEIVHGRRNTIQLGNLESRRDWGFAGDFVRAMHLMLNADQPDDYVIATGESHSVREFCEVAFARVGLDYREHVEIDPNLIRPIEAGSRVGSPSRAMSRLGWTPSRSFTDLVHLMVDADLESVGG